MPLCFARSFPSSVLCYVASFSLCGKSDWSTTEWIDGIVFNPMQEETEENADWQLSDDQSDDDDDDTNWIMQWY